MLRFKTLRLTTKLFLLAGMCLVGFSAFAIVAKRTLNEVQVKGPLYERIVDAKDVIADVPHHPNTSSSRT